MQSKPEVYVERITNLSDARYCAGMGVDMLGFVVNPDDVDYVSSENFQDMMGWIAGPRRVAQVGTAVSMDLKAVVNNYQPDFLHVPVSMTGKWQLPDVPILLEMSFGEFQAFISSPPHLFVHNSHLIITDFDYGMEENSKPLFMDSKLPVLLSITRNIESFRKLLEQTGAAGLVLQGSRELSPGLKDYDHLSAVLEELED